MNPHMNNGSTLENHNGLVLPLSPSLGSNFDKGSHRNPFDAVGAELGLLASGHGLTVEDGASVDGRGISGREWERVVERLKGFLSESEESE
jgi:hypothetical protein